jgi:hypothetical protein
MMGDKTARSRISIGLLCFVWLSVLLLAGCQTIQYESRLMKSAPKAEQATYTMTAAQLRLQLDDLAGVFTGTIETAADQVISESESRRTRRHALLWKINAIPIAYQALFQADPAVALVDTWVYSIQMIAYFEHGPGKDDFGQWQPIALEAARRLEALVAALAAQTRTDGNIEPTRDKIQTWVSTHPIQRDFVFRETAIPELSTQVGRKELSAFQTVGSLAVRMEDLAHQLVVYMTLLTKQARWQAELVMADADDDKAGIQSGIASLYDLEAAARRMTAVVEQAPGLVARERETMLRDLQKERLAILANIDAQRLGTLAYLTRERKAAIDDLKSLQRAITEILQSERKTILKSIDSQRGALLTEIESAGNRIVENALDRSKQAIDHFFTRIIQLLVVFSLVGGVGVAIAVYARRK